MENLETHNAIAAIMSFVQDCNQYIAEKAPWQIEKKEELNEILYNLADAIRITAVLIQPFMPQTSEKIFSQLNIEKNFKLEDAKPDIFESIKISKGEILFQKILTKEEKKQDAAFSSIKCEVEPGVEKLGIKVRFAELIGLSIKKKHMGLEKLKDEAEKKFKLNEKLIEGYENYHRKLNTDPNKCSVHNLINLVRKGGKLPAINTAVDCYNIVSLKKTIVVGAHDREKIKGNIRFKILNGTEMYIPLFQKTQQLVNTGEFGCVDDEKVLCHMDIKQGDQTKVTENTKNIILYVQGNENISKKELDEAMLEICNLIIKFCGGEYKILE